jgi:hypothetical protein
MITKQILAELDAEISRLQQAKAILAGTAVKRGPGRPAVSGTVKRQLSSEARARIAAAQKARWAKAKKTGK